LCTFIGFIIGLNFDYSMSFISRPNFLILLMFLLTQICISEAFGSGEEKKNKSFVTLSEGTGLELVGLPAYLSDHPSDLPPSDTLFQEFENTESAFLKLPSKVGIWIRVNLFNPSDSVVIHPVKVTAFPGKVDVFHIASGSIVKKATIGRLVKDTNPFESFYPTTAVSFQPGNNVLFIYHYRISNRNPLSGIRVSTFDALNYDKGDFIMIVEDFIFLLFAFVIFLVFQFCYVVIQGYYHRSAVYREYLLYIFCIGLYFTARLEMLMDYDFPFGQIPFVRHPLNDLMLFLPFAFYLRFSRMFIGTKTKFPDKDKLIRMVEKFIFLVALIYLVTYSAGLYELAGNISFWMFIPLFIFSLWLIHFFYKNRDKQLRFLLAGSLCVLIGHGVAMSHSLVPIFSPGSMFISQPLTFTILGILFEMFFFNTGLGYKAKYEQEEKIKAQEKFIGQIQQNEKIQMRLQNMRNKIASDLHDDVGSTLSSIGLYSEVGVKQVEKDPQMVKGILEKIASSSQRMMTAMNDIVWAIQSYGDQGESMMERLTRTARERLGPTGMEFELQFDPSIDHLSFTIEARRNILLLFKEAINNAVKYSDADKLKVELKISNDQFTMEIKDNGKGFDPATRKPGNGTISMQRRASELGGMLQIDSATGKGTVIRTIIPLAELI
jgi:signal transduction histidine kinase